MQIKEVSVEFFDPVDYILLSTDDTPVEDKERSRETRRSHRYFTGDWKVLAVDKLPTRQEIESLAPGPLPNRVCPSDHLPLSARLRLV
jgi:endonuclease/exonuclease/phosphatase family metal-dependent hydrolase